MTYMWNNYDTIRDRIENEFDEAIFLPESGLDVAEVNRAVRAVYDDGEKNGAPFAVTRAKMVAYALGNLRLAVNDFDAFAGIVQRQTLSGGYAGEIRKIQQERYGSIAKAKIAERFQEGNPAAREGLYVSHLDLSHTSPDWDNILRLGVPGLLARAEKCFDAAPTPFTESVKIVYTAFRDFVLRYAEISRMGGRDDLAEMLRFLADNPPVTLRQALELGILYRELQELEGEWVRSMGIFDRQYRPFYEQDLEEGRLTRESAEELLAIYFARFHAQSHGVDAGTPFCFGGFLPGDGEEDGCCELTRLAWKVFRRIGMVDPKFSLRVNPKTPDDILRQIAECIKEGKTATVFANETVARGMFLRHGKDPEDLANFVPIGCYEPAIMGKELSCTMTVLFNFAKVTEKLFEDPAFAPASFDELLEKYCCLEKEFLANAMEQALPWEKLWNVINPSPVLSGTMDECMARGLDVSEAGMKYATSGIMCAGIGTAADSLAAIRYLVFEKKYVTFAELRTILAANWAGHDALRQEVLRRAPKWGCDDDRADLIARVIADTADELIDKTPNAKGGFYQMGLWSIDFALHFGRITGATADGRYRGDPISKNTGSTIGCDREGAAGLIESVCKLDHTRFANGAVLDIMLPPRTVAGPEGTEFLCRLIRTFFAGGGLFVHFNILSPAVLKEAQKNPEKFRNLQIRLCGWNVRFVDLAKPMQDCLIREAESKEA